MIARTAPQLEAEVPGGAKAKLQKVGGEATLQEKEDDQVILLTQNNAIGAQVGEPNSSNAGKMPYTGQCQQNRDGSALQADGNRYVDCNAVSSANAAE